MSVKKNSRVRIVGKNKPNEINPLKNIFVPALFSVFLMY